MQVEVTGKTVEEAIQQALQQLGVTKDQVEVEVIESGTPGIFGIGGEPARVRVTVKNSPSTFVKGLLTAIVQFAGWKLTVEEPIVREGEIYINMEGDDAGLIIGKRGDTLNALQLLVQSAVAKRFPQSVRIVLDVSKYRERRRAAIIQLALSAAEKARSQKRLVRLRNLTAAERRIVHMTLQSDPTIFTLSEGEGENRVVIVAPMEMRDRLLRRQRISQRSASQRSASSQNKTENATGMAS
ncbi:MAG: protein jag [Armatimonadetes bacterium]|nr:protein jag [Armatimonadota bacterium]MCX7968020.1 protein jag [Armatimonadota bacterium]MDW8142335.1 RNA-binding cell elongation regulator Jag/EloR [Armatimonadota bacterium]